MKPMKRIAIVVLLIVAALSSLVFSAYAKTYSYNDLKLNYSIKRGLYGTGKNGYQLVIGVRKGNMFEYRKARVEYIDYMGHDVFNPYGKTYTAKLTKKTKYYQPISWSRQSKMKVWNYKYGEKRFKKLKILDSVSKNKIFGNYSLFYIKTKNGKVTKMISPLLYAL